MKYETPANANYVATIVQVNATRDVPGLDNLVAFNAFGYQALVSKDIQPGTIGVFFTAETQLSEQFAKVNNLHRHSDRNLDQSKTGYLEDSRRVKAIRLRGEQSNALFLSLDEVKWPTKDGKPIKSGWVHDFQIGDVFDKYNGADICKKYVIKEPGINKGPQGKTRRVDLKVFPLHFDTMNYWRNSDKIPSDAVVTITQKLHGTSFRAGMVPVTRDMTRLERILERFTNARFALTEVKAVAGSRMVVKSIDGVDEEGKQNFYSSDPWSEWLEKIKDAIPESYLVYGEIIGWTSDGKAIQPGYTYNLPVGESALYIYRVAMVTPQGRVVDLTWLQVKQFAAEAGLKTVPEITTMMHLDFVPEVMIDLRFYDQVLKDSNEYQEEHVGDWPVQLSDPKSVDEGVCIRYEGPSGPYILKAKSPIFLNAESKLLDQGIVDTESEEASL